MKKKHAPYFVTKNHMLAQQLQNLGFTKNEATVYLTLFELGQCKVGKIIAATNFHRNIIYRALDTLLARKLVHRISKRGVFYYEPADPTLLVTEIDTKKELAEHISKQLNSKRARPPSEVFVLSGAQGIQDVFNAVLQERADLYLIGANALALLHYREKFLAFDARRVQIGIRRFHLSIEKTRGTGLNELPNTQVKYLPIDFSSPLVIWIFGHCVAQILWEKPETIFLIRNEKLASDYRKYFQLLWDNDVRTFRGEEGARTFMNELLNVSDVYWIGGNGGVERFYPKVWEEHREERVRRKIFWHDLVDPGTQLSGIQKHGVPKGEYLELRQLPEMVKSPHVIAIYANRVANIIWKAGNDTVITVIEDKDLAEGYLKYWHYIWSLAENQKPS